ncbi:MAG: TRAM domain-containing protein, partial [Clostridia bacterium]
MLQKNTQITLQIENLGADAEGVGRADGLAVFVQGALPGETVRVRVIKTAQRYAVGKLEEICAPSQDRVQPPCPVYARCGGCAAQHMRYEATLCFKRQQAIDCLTRIGHIDAPVVHPVWGMETPWQYRNKGSFPVGGTTEEPQIGFYAPRSHTIIDAPQGCLLQRPQSDALVQACREWMTRYQIAPYAESTHTGLIRHIVTRVSQDGRAMVALVIHADALPHAQE